MTQGVRRPISSRSHVPGTGEPAFRLRTYRFSIKDMHRMDPTEFRMNDIAAPQPRHRTVSVMVGNVKVGGGAPIVVQSMTNTDTADVDSTARQVAALARAGSELVRITVDRDEAAAAVPHIK